MRESKFIVFLLVLASLSFAGLIDNSQYMLGGTIMLVIIILALLNMFASSLELPQLEAWVKTEIRELIAGAILIIIVFALFNASTGVVSILTGVTNLNSYTNTFFNNRIAAINTGYIALLKAFHYLGIKSGFSTSVGIPLYFTGISLGGAPYSGYGTLFLFLSQASQGLSTSLFIYEGMKVLMGFLVSVASPLLYIAFIFRVIPFTRHLGNTLIALVVGAGILLPLSIILVAQLHTMITIPNPDITDAAFENGIGTAPSGTFPKPVCSNLVVRTALQITEYGWVLIFCTPLAWIPGYFPICQNLIIWLLYPLYFVSLFLGWGRQLLSLTYGSGTTIGTAFDVLFPFLANVTKTVVLSYIDVVVVGIVTIIGTKSISSALGGEVFLSGIQRLL